MAIDEELGIRFGAVPVHTPRQHERLSLDTRLAKKFLRSTTLAPEERQQLASYVVTAKWHPTERCIYAAILDGFTTIPEIATVTGLTDAEVSTVINKLASKGIVKRIPQ